MTVYTELSSPIESQRSSLTESLLPTESAGDRLSDNEDKTALSDVGNLVTNINKILALTWFSFTGRSIWSQSVLSIFVYLQQKNNPERVGYVTAAMGMSQVLASLPAGCLARKWQRDTILKLGSIVGAGAVGLTAVAITKSNFLFLIIALSLWGVMWGITDTALPSLFVDSIPDDEQNSYFRCGSRIIRSANFLGPLAALVIFQCLGNQWTISNCSIVMGIGLAFCLPVIFILCCLRDNKADVEFDPPEEIHLQNPVHHGKPGLANNESSDCGRSMSNEPESFFASDVEEQGFDIDFDFDEHSRRRTLCCEEHVIVPTLITLADILSGIASGMSIRYFPVFFVEQLGLSPVSTQILYMIAPLGQAFFASLARRLAKSFGPSCVSVAFHWAFVIFLVSMLYGYLQGLSMWIVCSLYIVHTSLMNSTCSLSKVIMLNTVPEEEIQKWTVVETLQLFLWSGGAAVGGIIVGRKGIIFNFYVTAALQLFASLPLIILCCLGTKADRMNQGLFLPRMFTEDEDNAISIIAIEESEGEDDGTVFEDTLDSLDSSESEFFDCSSLRSSNDDDDDDANADPEYLNRT